MSTDWRPTDTFPLHQPGRRDGGDWAPSFQELEMPDYTIETSYRMPAYRHRTYQADTVALACRQAVEDDDWSGEELS